MVLNFILKMVHGLIGIFISIFLHTMVIIMNKRKKNSKYPDLFPFFIILQELGTCAIYIDPDLDKALTKKCEINKEINREILRRYEQ